MSLSATDLMWRRAALAMLQAAAERDAAERRRHCGEVADLTGFEDVLAERLQENVE
jgi:hypothetical protein